MSPEPRLPPSGASSSDAATSRQLGIVSTMDSRVYKEVLLGPPDRAAGP